MKLYEAMFIVNSNAAKENYEKVESEALACLTRHGAEIVNAIKWDERRMSYEIKNQKRGAYILCHFNAEPDAIVKAERQCRLSETVLRVLITIDVDGPEALPASSIGAETHAPVSSRRDPSLRGGGVRDRDIPGKAKNETDEPAVATTTPAEENSSE